MQQPTSSTWPSWGGVLRRRLGTLHGRRLRRHWGLRWPLLVLAGLGAVLLLLWRAPRRAPRAGSLPKAVAQVLQGHGLSLASETVHLWPASTSPLCWNTAVFAAARVGEVPDVYRLSVRVGQGGAIVDSRGLRNLTRSSSAAESQLVARGPFVAFVQRVQGRVQGVNILDLRGEPAGLTAGWSRLKRAQGALSNLQRSGSLRGIGQQRYRIEPPSAALRLTRQGSDFVLVLEDLRVTLDPVRPATPHARVRWVAQHKAQPGSITWLVDIVRGLDFVGPAPIEWLEHRVFAVKDLAERLWHDWRGDSDAEATDAMGHALARGARLPRADFSRPEAQQAPGFPPAALRPRVRPVLPGEGRWVPVQDDPFARQLPAAPPAFAQTFLRTDPERKFTRVYLVAWDARQVQLHMVAGTVEPASATGETGSGMIPRDAWTLGHLVAGFNGGFQALHGEFGMMAQGRIYLPPKPWAATVAVHRDGRVSMGSWQGPPEGIDEYRSAWAIAQVPEDMWSFRQNLTSVVEDGRFNPWERWWWGAAPVNAQEQTYIDRSGLCLTAQGHFIYFWGRSLSAESLGAAMLAADCRRGLHLDMNLRHTGFEFYNAVPVGKAPAPLGRPLRDSEYDGPLPRTDGFHLRARKAVHRMQPMRFPRYVGRDPRDFFYLTLRPTLPGPPLAAAQQGKDYFRTDGLPHRDHWPPPFARVVVGQTPGTRAWIVRLDPFVARPRVQVSDGETLWAQLFARDRTPTEVEIGWLPVSFGHRFACGGAAADSALQHALRGPDLWRHPDTPERAVAVDAAGFLLYAEREPESPHSLGELLRRAGAECAIALGAGDRLRLARAGSKPASGAHWAFVAPAGPATAVLFPDTEARPYRVWARLQDTRVRYIRQGEARFTRWK